jgi:hypothetical protein
MTHVRTLTSSPQKDLQLVATALIWKLEKESEISVKKVEDQSSLTSAPTVPKKQYDIMISYSHNDKELCDQILNSLKNDQFNVWYDSQLMHGSVFDAMAEAIENAEFVLVCMSDTYKQSPCCKAEATYAMTRRCQIIPLVMTDNYKADGWLGVLTSQFIRIDFPKLHFNKACEELKKQIQLYRTKNPNSTTMKLDPVHHDHSSLVNRVSEAIPSTVHTKEPRPIV